MARNVSTLEVLDAQVEQRGIAVYEAQQVRQSDPGSVAADACWLTGLQVMAVQPACLKAHPSTPLQPLQQHQGVEAATYGRPVQHDLLLHLEAILTGQHPASIEPPSSPTLVQGRKSAMTGFPAAPLWLPSVQLELAMLNRQMQLVHSQQFSLLQIVLQQQGQQLWPQQPTVFDRGAASSNSATAVAEVSEQDAEPLDFSQPAAATQATAGSAGLASSWTVSLNLHVTFPSRPTAHVLDALHLVLTARGEAVLQHLQPSSSGPQAAGTTGQAAISTAEVPSSRLQPTRQALPAGLVAEVPLLVLPAVAQQEVQQLLLPAMRQEVQAEQLHQQQRTLDLSPDEFARQVLQVECAAWQHFCQLANDVFAVMELSSAAEAEALAAAGPSTSAQAQNQAVAAAAAASGVPSIALVPAAQRQAVVGSVVALNHIAESVLFPLLLPFLAAHGLHNMLQLLVACLPMPLQLQWQQQQLPRLQHLAQTAPPALHLPVIEEDDDERQATSSLSTQPSAVQEPASSSESSEPFTSHSVQQQAPQAKASLQLEESAQGPQAAEVDPSHSVSKGSASWEPVKHQAAVASTQAPAAGVVSAAVADAAVTWLTPLRQFPGDLEQRYLDWKHHHLMHLDYLCALFDVMYLAVLLKRMWTEPTTLFYFLYICVKTLPHVPLMLGLCQPFLRYREMWIFMVAPACLVLTCCFILCSRSHEGPTLLLPAKAYQAFLASRAELITGFMRPFLQHMRLPLYMGYCLLDAAVTSWGFGQVVGVRNVAKRWFAAAAMSICVCWAFEFVLRWQFLARERRLQLQQHQAPTTGQAELTPHIAHKGERPKGRGVSSAEPVPGTSSGPPSETTVHSQKQKQL